MAAGATFAFEAVDLSGAPAKGELEAESKAQVAEQLRQRGLVVLDVTEKSAPVKVEDVFRKFKGVPMRDLSVASRQFATLIASGMPMLRALGTLEQQTDDEEIIEAIDSVRHDVEAGASLGQAMERKPRVFDRLYRSMVRSGEQSGRLEEALDRVATHIEKMDNLRREVRSALMYPALVFSAAIAAMIGIVAFVVPVFIGIFEELAEQNPEEKAELPMMTKVTVGVSDAITGYWFIVFPLVAFLVYLGFRWRATEHGRAAIDRIKLKLPFKIGDVIQKLALARWSRTFSGSVSAGVPILQAIQITGETSGNVVVEEAMEDVYETVKRGGSIAAQIAQHDIFPPMVANMVAVGEETGQLENMLTKIADFYEAEVDAKVKALTSLIEPILIVFIGAVVGFIVISMYLPIFSIYDKIRTTHHDALDILDSTYSDAGIPHQMSKERAAKLLEAIRYFSDLDLCNEFVAGLRWPNGPACSALRVRRTLVSEQRVGSGSARPVRNSSPSRSGRSSRRRHWVWINGSRPSGSRRTRKTASARTSWRER